MIVPLTSGGGMRVKIIEGMAFGKTIISTAVGAEGIDYTNGKDLLIANTENEFAEAIEKCLNDIAFSDSVGKNARVLAETKYDNQLICNKLSDFYKSLLN
jgi:glycosyltransferase involved in cell wall biosynthesis